MADVTREQLTAALERLGWTVEDTWHCPDNRPHWLDHWHVILRNGSKRHVSRGDDATKAIRIAFCELVPLDVLVRGVMGETTPTTGEIPT